MSKSYVLFMLIGHTASKKEETVSIPPRSGNYRQHPTTNKGKDITIYSIYRRGRGYIAWLTCRLHMLHDSWGCWCSCSSDRNKDGTEQPGRISSGISTHSTDSYRIPSISSGIHALAQVYPHSLPEHITHIPTYTAGNGVRRCI